jgi:hypothetical protein
VSAITKRDAIDAAMSVAEDVAEGKVDPAALDQAIADECRELFGTVVGPGDSLWPLHIDVCRQALALGALTVDELSEWLGVARSRAGEPVSAPEPPSDPSAGTSSAGGLLSPEIGSSEHKLTDDEPEPDKPAGNGPAPGPSPAADNECDCGNPDSTMVITADGRRIPRRLIIARGRGLPDPGVLS